MNLHTFCLLSHSLPTVVFPSSPIWTFNELRVLVDGKDCDCQRSSEWVNRMARCLKGYGGKRVGLSGGRDWS
jgi:hypothetical protein